ncbi:CLUMA_CG015536, isoform A [Clunio marinus]|uniref:CLUMA_CG015536, isoform A n=1 Tax=Clunio marinus TaxID=568069 RepID=A0A1J1IQM6_9DIPT|nr:CLUMA_CG015536, isoform A [Clunio marinus]
MTKRLKQHSISEKNSSLIFDVISRRSGVYPSSLTNWAEETILYENLHCLISFSLFKSLLIVDNSDAVFRLLT